MTFIDFFAGIGGFRRGMELAGHKCVGFCEFDKFAVASYTAMHLMTEEEREYIAALPKNKRVAEAGKEEYRHGEWYANDIRRIFAEDIPRADCWCFGFPCQDISVAGKQIGFKGQRSSLFFRVIRLIQDLEEEDRPTYLFIENVKNLLSVNGGTDFLKLLIALDESGYDVEWSVLNSKNFGVPQNRERVFIIGHLRGRGGREVFPVQGTDGENLVSIIGHRDGYRRNTQTYSAVGIKEALDTAAGGGREFHAAEPICMNPKGGRNGIPGLQPSIKDRVYAPNGVMPTVATSEFFNPNVAIPVTCNRNECNGEVEYAHTLMARDYRGIGNQDMTAVAVPVLTPDKVNKRQNGRRFKDNGEPMFTLTGQDRHGVAINVVNNIFAVWHEKYQCYIAIRRLTPKECFRLQGWDDIFFGRAEIVNSNSQLYKQAGNGVTVPVIREIAKGMR